jgi:hypothetical protein
MPLDAATASRLIKLLGMLGSEHAGEVANTGAAASRLLVSAGLTWADVVAVEPEPATGAWREPNDWIDGLVICMTMHDAPLTPWDRRFLVEISRQAALTEKQQVQLDRIVQTCRHHARQAA